ncbi:MAG: glutathione S-transferase N-terminal domain-containing protein [Actinomycetota bacterium]|nr:glutathione S-transferase N-terminal domain-containing protein [Actinomycetota bacterium]
MSAEPRLITLPISPFNELARWSLEWRGIPYREEPQILVWHVIASRRVGGGGTTPVLVADGEVVAESSEIAEWADRQPSTRPPLFPGGTDAEPVRRFVRRQVRELGPESRRLAWNHLIDDLPLADRYWAQGVEGRQRRWQPFLLRLGRPVVKRRLRVRPRQLSENLERVTAVFDEVAARLEDGRPYLFGESLTAADIAFAAMAMPAILPDQGYPVALPAAAEMGKMADPIEELRAHPAGQFALRLYRDHRSPSA